jgi:hypothetical protein
MGLVKLMQMGVCAVTLACDTTQLAAPSSQGMPAPGIQDAAEAAQAAGMQEQSISGVIQFVSGGPPGMVRVSPGGICHFADNPVVTQYQGDITGTVTFEERNQLSCSGGHLIASGPFEGEVTWAGRTGTITGQFETNCLADASQPLGVSCDGTSNARGSGGLEGVHFHYKWGTGWFPFSYDGTAFSQ